MVIDHPIFLESIKFIRSHLGANDLNYLEKKVLDILKKRQNLKSSCKIYVEFSKFTKIEIPDSFTIYKEKTLGDVKAYLLKYDN